VRNFHEWVNPAVHPPRGGFSRIFTSFINDIDDQLFYQGPGVLAFTHVFPWAFSAILAAQFEVIDFSFCLAKPVYCWAVVLFVVFSYAVATMFMLSPSESKAIRAAHVALIDAAKEVDPTGVLSAKVALAEMPILADGGKAIEHYAVDVHRPRASCLCHLERSIGANTLEVVLVKPVLWSFTIAQMAVEQEIARDALLVAAGFGVLCDRRCGQVIALIGGYDDERQSFGPCTRAVCMRVARPVATTNNYAEWIRSRWNRIGQRVPLVERLEEMFHRVDQQFDGLNRDGCHQAAEVVRKRLVARTVNVDRSPPVLWRPIVLRVWV
jgi:hypothetical protein